MKKDTGKQKFRETLRLLLDKPTVEYLDPHKVVIPDGEEDDSTWQRKVVQRQLVLLRGILSEGFDVFAVLVARLPDGRLMAIDGGQRTRAARDVDCKRITALVYKMTEDEAMRAFFALGETAPINSSHKVNQWPGPAGKFIREMLPTLKTRLSSSQFVRGLASYLDGKSCMQIQKGLQLIDREVSLRGPSTTKKAQDFIETQNRLFNGVDAYPPTMAVLASAIVLREEEDLPRKGKLSQTDWKVKQHQLGSTQNTLPSWLAEMRRGW